MIELTNHQARRFVLAKQGLLGDYRFLGKEGALIYVRQAGCIQFDPVDVCGKNAELTLQSRVKGFTKQTLYDLLYADRALVDYPDKNISVIPTADWPYFERSRASARGSGLRFEGLAALEADARAYIRAHGPVNSDELPIEGSIGWHSAIHWSGSWHGETNAARAVLEQLYTTGELVIHRKDGARKYYDLAERHIPADILGAPDPCPADDAHLRWRILRRIGAVGLMWDRPSDVWLNIWGLKTPERTEAFRHLLDEGKIIGTRVEGIRDALYLRAEDLPLLESVMQDGTVKPRCEFLAPLDPMLWDRKLIRALFGFDYTWEIYTPADKRKFGYYTLPVLYGDRFVARIDAAADRVTSTLTVKNVWYEDGVRRTKALAAAVERCIRRFARFNACENVVKQ